MRAVILTASLIVAGTALAARVWPEDIVNISPIVNRQDVCSVICELRDPFESCAELCRTCKPEAFCKVGGKRACLDVTANDDNCGGCGNKCGDGHACCNSECVPRSSFRADVNHCGKCNNKCPDGDQCHGRLCTPPRTCYPDRSDLADCQKSKILGNGGSMCGGKGESCFCGEAVNGAPFCGQAGGQACSRGCEVGDARSCQAGEVCALKSKVCCEKPGEGGKKGVCVKKCGGV